MATLPASDAFASTLRRILSLICATVAVGNFVARNAAAPATCGVAIEVPLKNSYASAARSDRST